MRRLGIYCSFGPRGEHFADDYHIYALRSFRPFVDFLYVVTSVPQDSPRHNEVRRVANAIVWPKSNFGWTGEGYRDVLANIKPSDLSGFDELLLFDSTFFGPVYPAKEMFDQMAAKTWDYWSATYFDTKLDRRFTEPVAGGRIPNWSLMVLRKPVLQSAGFREFWLSMPDASDYWAAFTGQEIGFAKLLHEAGFKGETQIDPAKLKSSDPRIYEANKLVEQRCPAVARAVFTLDPLVQDMQALQGRRTLELIRRDTSYDIQLIWRSLLRSQKPRDLEAALDLVEVLPMERPAGRKNRWKLGRVAVLAHVYYAEMLDEFLQRFEAIPVSFDLFITTASEDNRKLIEKRLKDLKYGKVEVRVVQYNRGRDMSSLFISLRDVVLSGKYELCLRLHSKRTPQMSPHVSETFMEHLVDNLVPNREFVANLFDLLEREPNIGLVIPPIIHIGFGTLGHSWNNNRAGFQAMAKTMGLNVPFDDHTPVAPYGTMYWFRCEALRPMFEYEWKWADYNPEPHHVDGGLAHIQERLIAYIAQKQGFRTETVISTKLAGRYYAKLEYKLQLLASCYPSAVITQQYSTAQADQRRREIVLWRDRIARRIAKFSKDTRAQYPYLWQMSRPMARRVWPVVKRMLS